MPDLPTSDGLTDLRTMSGGRAGERSLLRTIRILCTFPRPVLHVRRRQPGVAVSERRPWRWFEGEEESGSERNFIFAATCNKKKPRDIDFGPPCGLIYPLQPDKQKTFLRERRMAARLD